MTLQPAVAPVGKDDDLLHRLMSFELDDLNATLPFTRRLARENRWSIAYAVRVVREYKRFVFLAMRAGHAVTPSVMVDQAWHLHLLYTRSYWQDLCGEVLGCELHHGPTRGGSDEGARYREQYQQTMESYKRLLGQDPPAEIWPSVQDNFAIAAAFVFVNRSHYWFLPRPGHWRDLLWRSIRGQTP